MSAIYASALLRARLLEDVSIVLAGAAPHGADAGAPPDPASMRGGLGAAVAGACAGLGASVVACPLECARPRGVEQAAVERTVAQALALAGEGGVDMLAIDGAALFADAAGAGDPHHAAVCDSSGARAALHASLELAWNVTRAVADGAFLQGGRGGRIVYLTPARDQGEHADAARAGLENLARTLSIEWARHRVTAVAIAPAGVDDAAAREVGALAAYLASAAGAYFSGCLLDLTGER